MPSDRRASLSLDYWFRRHHVFRLLQKIGLLLPDLLHGEVLYSESRHLEQILWRELGYSKRPMFAADVPSYLRVDIDGLPFLESSPLSPIKLAEKIASLQPSRFFPLSPAQEKLNKLASLWALTSFESQWLRWSYCIRFFGRAIIPLIPLQGETQACRLLALLTEMPLEIVQVDVASRRLFAWGLIESSGPNKNAPHVLGDWMCATDQLSYWVDQH